MLGIMKRLIQNTEQLRENFPEEYEHMLDKLQSWALNEDNETTEGDVLEFEKGNWLAEIWTNEDETVWMYAAGRDKQHLNNQAHWGEDRIEDVEQGKINLLETD